MIDIASTYSVGLVACEQGYITIVWIVKLQVIQFGPSVVYIGNDSSVIS
jgi:hypothetical protein